MSIISYIYFTNIHLQATPLHTHLSNICLHLFFFPQKTCFLNFLHLDSNHFPPFPPTKPPPFNRECPFGKFREGRSNGIQRAVSHSFRTTLGRYRPCEVCLGGVGWIFPTKTKVEGVNFFVKESKNNYREIQVFSAGIFFWVFFFHTTTKSCNQWLGTWLP